MIKNEEEKYYLIFDLNDLEGEEWKDVVGYEGLYKVSNLGRVKSLNYNSSGKPKILKKHLNKDGYLQAGLTKDGKCKLLSVHRLVASAFIPNPTNLPQVNHKDEIKTNNVVSNLEWCTQEYNINYGTRIDRAAKANTNHPNKSKRIAQCDLNGNIINIWESSHEAERQYGFHQGNIIQCCKGNRKTHKGYEWHYFQPLAIIK